MKDKPITIEQKFDELLFNYCINSEWYSEQNRILITTEDETKKLKCTYNKKESFDKMINIRKQILKLLKLNKLNEYPETPKNHIDDSYENNYKWCSLKQFIENKADNTYSMDIREACLEILDEIEELEIIKLKV